jgi:hypothetical protein
MEPADVEVVGRCFLAARKIGEARGLAERDIGCA